MKKIGRYEVVEEVGRGAMGVVYKASDPTIGRLVAIKVLSLDSSSEEGGTSPQEDFMREARAAGRLSHPGIVTIHDALEDPETKSNYIVMEFIEGRTLEKILQDTPPPPLEKSLNIIRQIAEALEYAHQHQIIHRDLKPANILVTDDGRAKITDFGIARVMARDGSHRTASVMGTPAYMAPEQLTGAEIDARSDMFSLGVLVYLVLSGEKPFAGDTAAVLFKIVYEDPVPPSKIKPELGPGLDYIALRSLVKGRGKRYQNAREFLDDLDDVQHGRPPRSEAAFPLSDIRAGERTLVTKVPLFFRDKENAPATQQKISTADLAGMGAAAVLLIAILASGIFIYRSRHKPAPPPAVSQATATPPPQATTASPVTQATPKPPNVSSSVSKSNDAGARNSTGSPTRPAAGAKSQPAKKHAADSGAISPTPDELAINKKEAASPQGLTTAPTTSAKPAATPPNPVHPGTTQAPTASRVIQLTCKFELQDATLTISNDAGVIFHESLKGKKKSGLLHLKGGFGGTLLRTLTLPPGTTKLAVRVQSADGGQDLTHTTTVAPPANGDAILQVTVSEDRLNLRWAAPSHP